MSSHEDGKHRRLRRFYVGERDVWGLLLDRRSLPDFLQLPVMGDGIPDGAVVVDVCHDWSRKAFGFLLQHPSFSPIPEGEMIPELEVPYGQRFEVLHLDKKGDGVHDAYAILAQENERLRAIFGDLCQDDLAIKKAREQGYAEGYRRCRQEWGKSREEVT